SVSAGADGGAGERELRRQANALEAGAARAFPGRARDHRSADDKDVHGAQADACGAGARLTITAPVPTLSVSETGAIAQLGERYNGIVEVGGSIPPGSTTFPKLLRVPIV